ncbi:hypothetical protein GJ496_003329 [Pomphorhynchus laevis]|nr:hypothetical protein GJ496_003329 [Pomphorhynchus laevis]
MERATVFRRSFCWLMVQYGNVACLLKSDGVPPFTSSALSRLLKPDFNERHQYHNTRDGRGCSRIRIRWSYGRISYVGAHSCFCRRLHGGSIFPKHHANGPMASHPSEEQFTEVNEAFSFLIWMAMAMINMANVDGNEAIEFPEFLASMASPTGGFTFLQEKNLLIAQY